VAVRVEKTLKKLYQVGTIGFCFFGLNSGFLKGPTGGFGVLFWGFIRMSTARYTVHNE